MRTITLIAGIGFLACPLALLSSQQKTAAAPLLQPAADQTETTLNGRPLNDAPVPSVEPPGLPPQDRVAQPSSPIAAGPVNATPFSGTPSITLSEGGTQTAEKDRVLTPADTTGVIPNLGK